MWPNTVTKSDLRIEYYRGSGPGGQHRNKTNSACRITHIPTGISAQAEDNRCQHKNRRLAFRRLAEKLVPIMKNADKQEPEKSSTRIRTYHEPRGTVKDTRLSKTWDYDSVVHGKKLEELIEALIRDE